MKRNILCGLLAAAALVLPAKAARPVPVQVDGQELNTTAYLEQGVTYVPLRDLLDNLGGWEVWWNSQTKTADAASEEAQLSADPDANTITVNGSVYTARVAVVNGRTYLPLRQVIEALGGSAQWDPWLGGAAATTAGAAYDAVEFYWLARIISAESGGEPMEGQIAVGNVVLNRVESEDFPNSIPEVIFDCVDAVQFEPVENGTIYRIPSTLSVEAAKRVLNGENTVGKAMFFYAPALSEGIWINDNRTYQETIGCHRFYV